MTDFKIIFSFVLLFLSISTQAQQNTLKENYLGILPSVLVEPYDTINATEINVVPAVYERRFGEKSDIGIQFRPIINYRILEGASGISQVGGTLMVNKYFLNVFGEDFWLKPQVGAYGTYAYNLLDEIQTLTLGLEPGALIKIGGNWLLSVNVQPGINYYPDDYSREFVSTESGFKPHFGIIIHAGYQF